MIFSFLEHMVKIYFEKNVSIRTNNDFLDTFTLLYNYLVKEGCANLLIGNTIMERKHLDMIHCFSLFSMLIYNHLIRVIEPTKKVYLLNYIEAFITYRRNGLVSNVKILDGLYFRPEHGDTVVFMILIKNYIVSNYQEINYIISIIRMLERLYGSFDTTIYFLKAYLTKNYSDLYNCMAHRYHNVNIPQFDIKQVYNILPDNTLTPFFTVLQKDTDYIGCRDISHKLVWVSICSQVAQICTRYSKIEPVSILLDIKSRDEIINISDVMPPLVKPGPQPKKRKLSKRTQKSNPKKYKN